MQESPSRLPCMFVPNFCVAVPVPHHGHVRRRGQRVELLDNEGVVVDASSGEGDAAWRVGQEVVFPCHVAEIAAADRWGAAGVDFEVSNGERGAGGGGLLDRRLGSLPPHTSQISPARATALRRCDS